MKFFYIDKISDKIYRIDPALAPTPSIVASPTTLLSISPVGPLFSPQLVDCPRLAVADPVVPPLSCFHLALTHVPIPSFRSSGLHPAVCISPLVLSYPVATFSTPVPVQTRVFTVVFLYLALLGFLKFYTFTYVNKHEYEPPWTISIPALRMIG